ncbi:pentatricopeptide repeat-containing protein At4g14190, chloroplastic [Eucalyptus grandis]|uniref:pentatricopeptide repeat-containing protein At4g14190, chloroplastic n=1 Tax=Eucalyptus grandis TaxID=71139 RepID=UPI00192EF253|nr:pentatricopeptide repeat-containing protein At4g14190, chloroplastic [Eucalyptus grandis]XP_018721860.2 pentatricopeptide repeat-containing protein At4g14190, chloroplastic [Eucalyptus grandis]XP_018721862.2 pentatricopeptide repeat-containing protein At4g14190, chloroplastic [Eucalyptus grandis]XP_039156745.1 pentatricopeptide repeat-containing protein At4g14190, chloroplastic [Eucalyptus grandis]XP_039156746.1 pentatricopeptide repeat-containing protein At4g14190, chloroplastic [Eucalyptus
MEAAIKFQIHGGIGAALSLALAAPKPHTRRPTSLAVHGGGNGGGGGICGGKKSRSPDTRFRSRHEIEAPRRGSAQHRAILVEAFHEHRRLNALLQRLGEEGSCPLRLLEGDGDWTRDQFWAVVKSLRHASRSHEVLKVFDMWKARKPSRVTEFNYETIILLLCEEGLMDDAVSAFQEMKNNNLSTSVDIYNGIVHGYANRGNFDDALLFLDKMRENDLGPDNKTYNGLIRAYGKYKMYDELGMCVKQMELNRCSPDHVTYNLLIREFSRAGLLQQMEKLQRTMFSRRMYLQPSSLVSMLDAYANFGVLAKMEKAYIRVLNAKIPLKEDLIRKLAGTYIENYMFSRLDDLGCHYSSSSGSDLPWFLRLLSNACLLSIKGMDLVVGEMEEAGVPWSMTLSNTVFLALLKMKHFKHLRTLLLRLPAEGLKPDIVTVGVLLDANRIGFDGFPILDAWRRLGFLYRDVEMETDPLVLTAFGKGHFLRSCEDIYYSFELENRAKTRWTYNTLIDSVSELWKADSFKTSKCSVKL